MLKTHPPVTYFLQLVLTFYRFYNFYNSAIDWGKMSKIHDPTCTFLIENATMWIISSVVVDYYSSTTLFFPFLVSSWTIDVLQRCPLCYCIKNL